MTETVQFRRLVAFLEDAQRYSERAADADLGALAEGCYDDLARVYMGGM